MAGETGKRLNLAERQSQLNQDGYAAKVQAKFWSEANVTGLSVLVIGQRYPGTGRVELALRIHVDGTDPIAARQGTATSKDGASRFTFFQNPSSVFTHSYSAYADASYNGADPPTFP